MNPNKVEKVQDPVRGKEPYQRPEVKTFGSVAKLTLGGNGTKVDGCSHKAGKSNGGC